MKERVNIPAVWWRKLEGGGQAWPPAPRPEHGEGTVWVTVAQEGTGTHSSDSGGGSYK